MQSLTNIYLNETMMFLLLCSMHFIIFYDFLGGNFHDFPKEPQSVEFRPWEFRSKSTTFLWPEFCESAMKAQEVPAIGFPWKYR